ncbi:hypothetical protein FQR65_LT16095 [Abscondita terminalis]|nr:hypothetical protein FQR65_LT16095 [Abscondita terminalis]
MKRAEAIALGLMEEDDATHKISMSATVWVTISKGTSRKLFTEPTPLFERDNIAPVIASLAPVHVHLRHQFIGNTAVHWEHQSIGDKSIKNRRLKKIMILPPQKPFNPNMNPYYHTNYIQPSSQPRNFVSEELNHVDFTPENPDNVNYDFEYAQHQSEYVDDYNYNDDSENHNFEQTNVINFRIPASENN